MLHTLFLATTRQTCILKASSLFSVTDAHPADGRIPAEQQAGPCIASHVLASHLPRALSAHAKLCTAGRRTAPLRLSPSHRHHGVLSCRTFVSAARCSFAFVKALVYVQPRSQRTKNKPISRRARALFNLQIRAL